MKKNSESTRKKKRVVGIVIAIVVVIGVLWVKSLSAPIQSITLPNGRQFRFAGTTYGTNHVQGSTAARIVNRLPKSLANFIRKRLGTRLDHVVTFRTQETSLVVWIRELQPGALSPAQYYGALGYGDRLIGSSQLELGTIGERGVAFFPLVPKRHRTLRCWLIFNDQDGGAVWEVSFPNPLYGHFPQWHPESLPATKRSRDLEVRVQGIRAVAATDTTISLDFHSMETTNEIWAIQSAELSDATGNRIRHSPEFPSYPFDRRDGLITFRGTLWPDEEAWRLTIDFKRLTNFAAGERVTFKNVPLLKPGATNTIRITNTIGGVQIVLRQFMPPPRFEKMITTIRASSRGSIGMSSTDSEFWSAPKFDIEITGKPEGWAVDLVDVSAASAGKTEMVKITENIDDMEANSESFANIHWLRNVRYFALKTVPADAQTVDITWVVQKTRAVEFLLKPPTESWQENGK